MGRCSLQSSGLLLKGEHGVGVGGCANIHMTCLYALTIARAYDDSFNRQTFLIDPKGKVAYAWEKVVPGEHVDSVLAKLEELQKNKKRG